MMTNRHGPVFAAVLILLAAGAVIRAQTPGPQQALRGSIRIVGTDTMKELMDRWIAGFIAIHPGVRIELAAKGALTAAPALSDGSGDLAMLYRGMDRAPPIQHIEHRPRELLGAQRHRGRRARHSECRLPGEDAGESVGGVSAGCRRVSIGERGRT